MKRRSVVFILITAIIAVLAVSGCGKKNDGSLAGVWEYADTENGLGAVYDLKDDGTGTYTMKVGDTEVTYELKYEVQNGHLLVRFVNNESFSEDDVFDSEFSFKDANTLIIKDSSGEEMVFAKK